MPEISRGLGLWHRHGLMLCDRVIKLEAAMKRAAEIIDRNRAAN